MGEQKANIIWLASLGRAASGWRTHPAPKWSMPCEASLTDNGADRGGHGETHGPFL
jgi:hypothetical protein